MSKMRSLGRVKCSTDEAQVLVDFVMGLRKDLIGDFLTRHGLSKSGNKREQRRRLENALADQVLAPTDLVICLDEVAPWGKQHVYLYNGPTSNMQRWRDQNWLSSHLRKNRVRKYLNAILPIALPGSLRLSSIQHDERRLRIIAVHRKVYRQRRPEFDQHRSDNVGANIELDAYERTVTRGLVVFEWDIVSNTAMLQITQLQSEGDYERTAKEFSDLVQRWLNLDTFIMLDVRRAINALHKNAAAKGGGEVRLQDIGFRTLMGRRLIGKSPSRHDPLYGESAIDNALRDIGDSQLGHIGNFYWLPNTKAANYPNPLTKEVHVYIIGDKNRIRFSTPNNEDSIRYVLRRIRDRCQ